MNSSLIIQRISHDKLQILQVYMLANGMVNNEEICDFVIKLYFLL